MRPGWWTDESDPVKPLGAADRADHSRVHPTPPAKWRTGRSSYMRSKVYVLQLDCGKYYVGRCTSFPKRVQYHIEGRGALWTQLYRPVASHAFFWGEEERGRVRRTERPRLGLREGDDYNSAAGLQQRDEFLPRGHDVGRPLSAAPRWPTPTWHERLLGSCLPRAG